MLNALLLSIVGLSFLGAALCAEGIWRGRKATPFVTAFDDEDDRQRNDNEPVHEHHRRHRASPS